MFINCLSLIVATPLLLQFGFSDLQAPAPSPREYRQPQQKHSAQAESKAKAEKNAANSSPATIKTAPSKGVKPVASDNPADGNKKAPREGRADRWINRISSLITAIATAVMAWFVFALSQSTKKLWQTSKKSAGVAERSLNELESPYLFIEIMDSGMVQGPDPVPPPPRPWSPFFEAERPVLYRFVNHGKTPAIVLQSYTQCAFIEDDGKEPSRLIPGKIKIGDFAVGEGVISANGGFSARFSTGQTIPQGRKIDKRPGKDSLWFQGYVRYKSFFNYSLVTGFRAKFDFGQGKFVLDGDERYNYTRKEEPEL